MLDISFIIENKDIVKLAIKNKNKEDVDLDEVENLYNKRLELLKKEEDINREKKEVASNRDIEKGKQLKKQGAEIDAMLKSTTIALNNLISKIPNIPLPDVPIGLDDTSNVVLREVGEKKVFNFKPKPHWDIGEERDFIDSKRASKTTKSRFSYLKGDIVRLQFALVNYCFDVLTDENVLKEIIEKNNLQVSSKPFIPVIPPAMISPPMLYGMGRLDPVEDKFFIEKENLFLSGSAEHNLGSMHSSETFNEKDLPMRYIGYSTAFRREAGSYGRDTRGIIRQHQFDKAEMESFTKGELSKDEQDFFVAIQEHLVKGLDIPYRVVICSTGDMGAPDLRQIDIECFMPGEDSYRETHSADLMGEYQARRLGIKVKREDGKSEYVHTNDATAFAIGRMLIAIIENYQNEDGTITIPEALVGYMNGKRLI